MTEEQARKTANFVMAAAALGAAVLVLLLSIIPVYLASRVTTDPAATGRT